MILTVYRLTGFAFEIARWLWREHRKAVIVAALAVVGLGFAMQAYESVNAPLVHVTPNTHRCSLAYKDSSGRIAYGSFEYDAAATCPPFMPVQS